MFRYLLKLSSLLALRWFSALRFSQIKYILSLILLGTLLTACGGGGTSSEDFTVFGSGGLNGTSGTTGTTGTGTTGVTVLRIGNGTGSSFTQGEIATSPDADLEAGESVTVSVNIVNESGNAITEGAVISFSSNCVASGLATFSEASVSTTTGLASTTYTAQGCNGNDLITATLQENGNTATVTLTIAPNNVLAVQYVSATDTHLALAGSGDPQSTELTFKVTGANFVPVPNQDVSFAINSTLGDAAILSSRVTGTTDNQGLVKTILESGTVAGNVYVLATHDATGTLGISEDIVISSGVPDAAFFSLSSGAINPSGAFNTDAVEVSFSIIASDQFGNNPPDGTRISFVSPEAGNITPSCDLTNGICSVTWRSSETRPADMRVGIIAYTAGAEAFSDADGNAVFGGAGVGDTFTDLPEPFVDENENGIYDLGEFFVDTNANGIRDVGNSAWDGPCLSGVSVTALCTGETTVTISATRTIVMPFNTARLFSNGTFGVPGTTITLQQGTSTSRSGIVIADANLNSLATAANPTGGNPMPSGTTIAFSIDGSGASLVGLTSWTVESTTAPTGTYGATVRASAAALASDLPSPMPTLLLTITPPAGAPTQFSWPLDITL